MRDFQNISFQMDDGSEVEFCILEQTMINGVNYLLITEETEEDVEEAEAHILKECAVQEEEGVSAYEFVEDEEEILAVSKVFEQIMDDMDIEVED